MTHVQVGKDSISALTCQESITGQLNELTSLKQGHRKDPSVLEMILYKEEGSLPVEEKRARKITLQAKMFALVDGTVPTRKNKERVVVPTHLRDELMQSDHLLDISRGTDCLLSYFNCCGGKKCSLIVKTTARGARNVVLSVEDRDQGSQLSTILVGGPFQILGINVTDLLVTEKGNK